MFTGAPVLLAIRSAHLKGVVTSLVRPLFWLGNWHLAGRQLAPGHASQAAATPPEPQLPTSCWLTRTACGSGARLTWPWAASPLRTPTAGLTAVTSALALATQARLAAHVNVITLRFICPFVSLNRTSVIRASRSYIDRAAPQAASRPIGGCGA